MTFNTSGIGLVLIVSGIVGFVFGLVVRLIQGAGWGSLLTGLETGLTTAAASAFGWLVAGVAGMLYIGANGLVNGFSGIYRWWSITGWLAFILDHSWGLLGNAIGNLLHIIDRIAGGGYRSDLSRRRNRHLFEHGFAIMGAFTFTQGNVISNATQGGTTVDDSFITNHEELHIWQNRIFGPLFQIIYVSWLIIGALVGIVIWFFHTDQSFFSVVQTAAYYDNPFEYWAYKNDHYWPPTGSSPVDRWPA